MDAYYKYKPYIHKLPTLIPFEDLKLTHTLLISYTCLRHYGCQESAH